MFTTDLSLQIISNKIYAGASLPTQTKQSSQKEANGQQRESHEELAALSDCWYEGIANGALPDLVQ
jgi:hypothetical protein